MKSDQFFGIPPVAPRGTMAQRVAEHLARLIADGTLAPGDRLPGEPELARRLGVSRPTLREALGMLHARRLVEVRPRSGTFVASALPAEAVGAVLELVTVDPTKIWELLEIRRLVDGEVAALAARRRTPSDLARLEELATSVASFAGDALVRREEGGRAYARFFAHLARATHNTLLAHLVESVFRTLRSALPYSRARLASQASAGDTIRTQLLMIMEAVAAGDPDAARACTVTHLDFVERALRGLGNPHRPEGVS